MAGDKAWDQRQWCHRHNGLLGQMGRARASVRMIQCAESVTPWAKQLLVEVENLLELVGEEIYARRLEPDGTVKEVGHYSGTKVNRERLRAGPDPVTFPPDKYARYRKPR